MAVIAADDKQRIKEIVCDILEIDKEEITDTSLFVEDHEADSLRLLEILSSLELGFDVTIDQTKLPELVNLASLYEAVAESKR